MHATAHIAGARARPRHHVLLLTGRGRPVRTCKQSSAPGDPQAGKLWTYPPDPYERMNRQRGAPRPPSGPGTRAPGTAAARRRRRRCTARARCPRAHLGGRCCTRRTAWRPGSAAAAPPASSRPPRPLRPTAPRQCRLHAERGARRFVHVAWHPLSELTCNAILYIPRLCDACRAKGSQSSAPHRRMRPSLSSPQPGSAAAPQGRSQCRTLTLFQGPRAPRPPRHAAPPPAPRSASWHH
jgi:hypothetical protein